jgi:hypothetical protein
LVTSRYLCICVCVCVCVLQRCVLTFTLAVSRSLRCVHTSQLLCSSSTSKILPSLTQRQFPRTLAGFPVPRHNGEGDRRKQCSGFLEGKVTVSDTVQRWWAQFMWTCPSDTFILVANGQRASHRLHVLPTSWSMGRCSTILNYSYVI